VAKPVVMQIAARRSIGELDVARVFEGATRVIANLARRLIPRFAHPVISNLLNRTQLRIEPRLPLCLIVPSRLEAARLRLSGTGTVLGNLGLAFDGIDIGSRSRIGALLRRRIPGVGLDCATPIRN